MPLFEVYYAVWRNIKGKEKETMKKATCGSVMAVLAVIASLTTAAKPMIDDAHDRVQSACRRDRQVSCDEEFKIANLSNRWE